MGLEGLIFALLGLVVVALPIALVYLLVSHTRLKTRFGELELQVATVVNTLETPPHRPEALRTNIDQPVPEPKIDIAGATVEAVSEPPRPPAPPQPAATDSPEYSDAPPRAYVFRSDLAAHAGAWFAQNWFLAIAALSLGLAGVFLVQYGVERGLLTPFWRVMGAAALGVILIWAGEFLRRRWGDEAGTHSAYLPSTFAGAGLVTLFVAGLAARQLYGLIGPETAFAALVAVSGLAVALGWFYGPFLAVAGILGAIAAPFMVGGASDTPQIYFYYFALIAIAGLLVDALRRWAWTSVLVLIFSHGGAWVIFMSGVGDVHYLCFALITAAAAAIIPPLRWQPVHSGPMVLEALLRSEPRIGWPEFPTRLASGAFAAAVIVAGLVAVKDTGSVEVWASIAAVSALYLAAAIWLRGAPALTDLAPLAPLAFLLILAQQGDSFGTLARAFAAERPPESPPPLDVTILSAIAIAGSALAAWRSLGAARWRLAWAGGASLFAPLALVALDIWWRPATVLGPGLWAGHAIFVAVVMTVFADRCGHADGSDKQRPAVFAMAALTMIAFALILVLSDVALTLALAVMVALAALIDRWLGMRLLAVFVQAGVVIVGWRLILDPGIVWAENAPLWELWLGYGGAIILLAMAWVALQPTRRPSACVILESAIWMLAGVFACVLIYRALGAQSDTHWGVALLALVWLIAMAGQLYRLRAGGPLRWVRMALGVLFATLGFAGQAVVVTILNPLLTRFEIVLGPPILDTLFVAFALPAIALGLFAWRLDHLPRLLRMALSGLAAGLGAAYMALEIRRAWRGDVLEVPGTTDPELYSYTVAMLVTAVVLLFLAFARRSVLLRRVAVIGIGLTIAKVFLIDMSGLAGLVRVASFLGLGLSLAGLAWISRRMTEQWDIRPDQG